MNGAPWFALNCNLQAFYATGNPDILLSHRGGSRGNGFCLHGPLLWIFHGGKFLVLIFDVTNGTVALAHSLTWVDSGNALLLLIEKANTGKFLFMLTNR